ncbi:MAG TPA: hypothetical protein PKW98_14560 [Candidatus Wallbacteria bacterium]|nr:hypothetical protein [Candidatus Wallbacteria bacterium]
MYFTGRYYYFDAKKYIYDNFLAKEPEEIKLSDSSDSNITVTPVLDIRIDKKKNMIFCSTVQMAWNELTKINEKIIEISKPSEYVSKLNLLADQLPLLSEDAYLVMAGLANYLTPQKIKEALKSKFGKVLPASELDISLNEIKQGDIYSFSFLFKNLIFKKEFKKIDRHLFKFNGKKSYVKAFGFSPGSSEKEEMIKQCDVYYDKKNSSISNNFFVIKMKTKSDSDEIVISNFNPEETLEKTYKSINDFINNPENKGLIRNDSYLRIPKVHFNILINYNNMCGEIKTGKYKKYLIGNAIQKIKFNLNEKGAYLLSYALITYCVGELEKFIIDRPFFIYLKDKEKNAPYFMTYIADDTLLVKSDEQGESNNEDR